MKNTERREEEIQKEQKSLQHLCQFRSKHQWRERIDNKFYTFGEHLWRAQSEKYF